MATEKRKRNAPIDWSGSWSKVFGQLAPGYDPRHIEGYIRLQYSTLSHLDRATLRSESKIAMSCVDQAGPAMAESNAKSFGL